MKHCSNPHIVSYYGSYWKREENEMWVCIFEARKRKKIN